jgi:hypothetical protein
VRSLGDRYLRDVVDLRAGEKWEEQLLRLIEEADVFQLFWSTNSMCSPFVRQEWEHALVLDRSNFIRPTYWEIPMPESSDPPLPPEALRRLHFHWLACDTFAIPAATAGMAMARPTLPPSPPKPQLSAAAWEQKLEAWEQKLEAWEQKLEAWEQKLEAWERRLVAREQRLQKKWRSGPGPKAALPGPAPARKRNWFVIIIIFKLFIISIILISIA